MKMNLDNSPRIQKPAALLTPGIGIAYSKAVAMLKDDDRFKNYCEICGISDFLNMSAEKLDDYAPFLEDTLENQLLAYACNCTMADNYRDSGVTFQVGIGYSMGIYAALYAAGYYTFESGRDIIRKAFELAREHCRSSEKQYGMGLILGLDRNELEDLVLEDMRPNVLIAVYNGKRSFAIAGEKASIESCLEKSIQLGALAARAILTEHPYHMNFLKDIEASFRNYMSSVRFHEPQFPVLSLIDGHPIAAEHAGDAIVQAFFTPLHFDLALEKMFTQHGIWHCYETGPSQSMKKLARYINRKLDVKLYQKEVVI